MRHLRPFTAFFAIAAVAAACASSSPGASTGGDQSQGPGASTGGGGGASQPAASTGGGGGGGGGGANGSIHYEITGDATKSGDLDFFANAGVSQFVNGGWVAYFYNDSDSNKVIQINSNPASNIFNYGDGEILVVGTEDLGCTFDYSRNDSGGLKGTIDCSQVIASNATSGAQIHVKVHATVDAHT